MNYAKDEEEEKHHLPNDNNKEKVFEAEAEQTETANAAIRTVPVM